MDYPIKHEKTVRENAMMLRNCNARNAKRLDIQTVTIQPYDEKYAFAHHGAITYFKGRFYAMWSSGRVNEDDCGQRVLWSVGERFISWTEPQILSDSEWGEHSEYVKFAQGFVNTGDELYAYWTSNEIDKKFLDGENLRPKNIWDIPNVWATQKCFCAKLNDDGISFSEPIEVAQGGGNHSAEMGKNGRMIIPLSTGILYTDNFSPKSKWKYSGISEEALEKARKSGAGELCEASQYYTDDGILHLVMRSSENRLWYAESYDNGETFTDVFPTCFTDDLAKFQFGRLPNNKYYYVGNPIVGKQRNALMLYTSSDGFNFDKSYVIRDEFVKICKRGYSKGGHYGYPECIIVDGFMYVIYSKQKEKMEITAFDLDQLNEEN